MIWLILFLILDFVAVGIFENSKKKEYTLDTKALIRDAKYHEAHPEVKRSVRFMIAGYFGTEN